MKVGVIDAHTNRRQAIHAMLQSSHIECVPLFFKHQVFEAIGAGDLDLLIVGSYGYELPGLALVRSVRVRHGRSIAIVYLSDAMNDAEHVCALNHGADLCFGGDVHPPALLAYLEALIRRSTPVRSQGESEIEFGHYKIDGNNRIVHLRGAPVTLCPREFELAQLLFENIGRTLTRVSIELVLWGRVLSPSRTLDAHLSRVRKKLMLGPENGVLLRTFYGRGFRLERIERTPA